jgi:hypothetical protein
LIKVFHKHKNRLVSDLGNVLTAIGYSTERGE